METSTAIRVCYSGVLWEDVILALLVYHQGFSCYAIPCMLCCVVITHQSCCCLQSESQAAGLVGSKRHCSIQASSAVGS